MTKKLNTFSLTKSWKVKAKTINEALYKTTITNYDSVSIKRTFDSESDTEHNIPIKTVLERALRHLKIQQWVNYKYFDAANKHLTKAIALIETVEIHDCGSAGGFGKGQRKNGVLMYGNKYHDMFARFLWLYKKYVTRKDTDLIPDAINSGVSEFWRKR